MFIAVYTMVHMFTCDRCYSVPPDLLLELKNLFFQLLEMLAADDSHLRPVQRPNSVEVDASPNVYSLSRSS